MRAVLALAAIAEAATGLALLIAPGLVVALLFGQEPAGMAVVLAGVAGVALIGLGLACWPGPARLGMLVYGAGVTLYLLYATMALGFSGPLLWPAVAVHIVLTVLLLRASAERQAASPDR